jgi:hypothetical protein
LIFDGVWISCFLTYLSNSPPVVLFSIRYFNDITKEIIASASIMTYLNPTISGTGSPRDKTYPCGCVCGSEIIADTEQMIKKISNHFPGVSFGINLNTTARKMRIIGKGTESKIPRLLR